MSSKVEEEEQDPEEDEDTKGRQVQTSLAFRQFFWFFEFLASTPELGPQNPSLGRKFCVESDFQVKNSQFQRPDAKN